ncbi:MAG: 2-dehydro-3-deoxygalactonokinase [Pseudomonadales bacterium]
MNQANFYIAGDWGTSNLRLYLVDTISGQCAATKSGPGISQVNANEIPDLLARLCEPWLQQHNISYSIYCGMVGSTIGWADAGYLDCPLDLNSLANKLCSPPNANMRSQIIPGVRCNSPTGATDVMRGEETQILGAIQKSPELLFGKHLLCLPGTHNKWVALKDGVVESFITSVCGELFSSLTKHSVLTRGATTSEFDKQYFIDGVIRSSEQRRTDLIHLLFETRSRQLGGQLPQKASADFLSGLIIGRDLLGACDLYSQVRLNTSVKIIADSSLSDLYALAGDQLDIPTDCLDGQELSRMGIHSLYRAANAL